MYNIYTNFGNLIESYIKVMINTIRILFLSYISA